MQTQIKHLILDISGFVQGVGFRPFIYCLAQEFQQGGWIANTPEGVRLAIEGDVRLQELFLDALANRLPPGAEIDSIAVTEQQLAHFEGFHITPSNKQGKISVFVLPDRAICAECLQDINNPASRFFRYPFTSCSVCGPRYSIMSNQPYDRQNTSMAAFALCPDCAGEYGNASNRRFHAQTLACPQCGPRLTLLDEKGHKLARDESALLTAIEQLKAGKIVALKGIGGFQLLADAANQDAIIRLRHRKNRPAKPFALMVPDQVFARALCYITEQEQAALISAEAPIVLLRRRQQPELIACEAVAPNNALLGLMLPYSPLHHLIMAEFGSALAATSGNRQDEPICIDDDQALSRLAGIADCFLTHDRAILRPLDDSVVREINGRITVLRRARGYVPAPVKISAALPATLAVGGQMKNTVAVASNNYVIPSQHLGDLESQAAREQFTATLAELPRFYGLNPGLTAHDLHPDYASSRIALNLAGTKQAVQHHYAHALACMAEHGLEPPCLAATWDGTGLGDDHTLWGGEFLLVNKKGFSRFAHFRTFPLPGGTSAIREPRRTALGLQYEITGDSVFNCPHPSFSSEELNLLKAALERQVNCPRTSSAGRLFDAVASLLGLCQINAYEGQAALQLEQTAWLTLDERPYAYKIEGQSPAIINWQSIIEGIMADRQVKSHGIIAAKFHVTLAEIILNITELAGEKTIVLSGGCFQNALLTEQAVNKLEAAGFNVFCHEKMPPNDGGLALGQAYAANFLR